MDIEEKLSQVPFYQIHPEYKPFVGGKYDQYRILIVGESHFIGQKPKEAEFTLEFFKNNWWTGKCDSLHEKYKEEWYTTRNVIRKYENGERTQSHGIFTNCIKSFSKVVLKEEIPQINLEESKKIECLAFMNFFQMPSIFRGMKFWNSLLKSATHEEARNVWGEAVEVSSKVLDAVIEAIEPELVIFVSKSAFDAYKNSDAQHKKDDNVKRTCHPACCHWNKRRKDGGCGREDFEIVLLEHIIKRKNATD